MVLALAAVVLIAAAWLRGAEYDEQYTLFLTAGTPRPDWPRAIFPAGMVAELQAGHASLSGIAKDLRATDVHPPLYFWTVAIWREVFGPSLFAARMLSVVCGVASIVLTGLIARQCGIPPALAMLITLGCYGFVSTNAVARGFALAEALTLGGVVLLLGRRPVLAGLCLGAACCCNYLAVFVAGAVAAITGAWLAVAAALPFLALDAWFFAAQHAARPDQFPPFRLGASLWRLAEYQTASVFGGLPLYVDGGWRDVVQIMIGSGAIAVVLAVARGGRWITDPAVRLLLAAAVATPAGLLLLGAAFDNTPIELRYLCFGVPFVALLITATLPLRQKRWPPVLLLGVQLASIIGLLVSPRTMQPARMTAGAAARLADQAILLLPAGNDGVGIVGAFGIEAPPSMPILLIRPDDAVSERVAGYHRVALALLAQDRDSALTVVRLRAVFILPNWRRVAIGSNLEVYERVATGG